VLVLLVVAAAPCTASARLESGSAVAAATSGTGEITGTVTDAITGAPLAGVTVKAWRPYSLVASATSGADGSYTVSGLPASNYPYTVSFELAGSYPEQWYHDNPAGQRDQLIVGAGKVTADVDQDLEPGGKISGTVTDARTGAPVGGVSVLAAGPGTQLAVCTHANGTYSVPDLVPGSWYVTVGEAGGLDFDPFGDFFAGCGPNHSYAGDYAVQSIGPVAVNWGSTSATDFALGPGGDITGTATDAGSHQPLADLEVSLYGPPGTEYGPLGPLATTCTDANGQYSFKGLSTDRYSVWFGPGTCSPGGGAYLVERTPASVTAGSTTAGADGAVETGSSITGTVTGADTHAPLGGVAVFAYGDDPEATVDTCTASDGTYTLHGLHSGNYTVSFNDGCSSSANYLPQSNPVSVGVDTTLSHVDAALVAGAVMSGTVTDQATHDPVQGVTVKIFDGGGASVDSACTGADGAYTASRLKAGSYRVEFVQGGADNCQQAAGTIDYVAQYFDGKSSLADADPVAVTPGVTTSGIGAALVAAPVGKVSGTVTDATHPGVDTSGISVGLFDSNDNLVKTTSTGTGGTYLFDNVRVGDYRVAFAAPYSTGYQEQFYDGATSFSAATPITVTADATTSGIDAALTELTCGFSGTITDEDTQAPIAGATVTIYAYATPHDIVATATTNANGQYSVDHLPGRPRSTDAPYLLGVAAPGYFSQYYHGQSTLASANTVFAPNGGNHTVDVALAKPRGAITGTVTDAASHAALSGVSVILYSASGAVLRPSAQTSVDGKYEFSDVVAGDYRVGFIADGYPRQYYDGASSLADSDLVTVRSGSSTKGIDAALGQVSAPPVTTTTGTTDTPPPPVTTTTGTTETSPPSGPGGSSAGENMPKITALTESHRSWRERSARRRAGKPVGTTIALTLSVPATVTLTFARLVPGRESHGRCAAVNQRGRRCVLSRAMGRMTITARAGRNALRFTGRLPHARALAPGRYRLTAIAHTVGGGSSPPRTINFTIV
jgi:hypothetical protein